MKNFTATVLIIAAVVVAGWLVYRSADSDDSNNVLYTSPSSSASPMVSSSPSVSAQIKASVGVSPAY